MIKATEARFLVEEKMEEYANQFDYLDEQIVNLLPEIEELIREKINSKSTVARYFLPYKEEEKAGVNEQKAGKLALLLEDFGYKTEFKQTRFNGQFGSEVTIRW